MYVIMDTQGTSEGDACVERIHSNYVKGQVDVQIERSQFRRNEWIYEPHDPKSTFRPRQFQPSTST